MCMCVCVCVCVHRDSFGRGMTGFFCPSSGGGRMMDKVCSSPHTLSKRPPRRVALAGPGAARCMSGQQGP